MPLIEFRRDGSEIVIQSTLHNSIAQGESEIVRVIESLSNREFENLAKSFSDTWTRRMETKYLIKYLPCGLIRKSETTYFSHKDRFSFFVNK